MNELEKIVDDVRETIILLKKLEFRTAPEDELLRNLEALMEDYDKK